ncbi:hypothetical protein [Pantoea ananatis]|jgi:hypothetical protein|uniref:hypothetical protein n=1 Tax=Pantoea ananas TaxID=553 RepID=UPI0025CB14E5|nr:hypothetical protein [Pantoea ananatis]MDN4131879.1 hypothetical protein [Pantoea ananatis]
MSDLKTPWSVHVDHQTSPGRFDVFSSEGHLVAVATTRERADLICAVPDLLNMLQATTLYIEKNANDGSGIIRAVLDASNAAIAKALGQ